MKKSVKVIILLCIIWLLYGCSQFELKKSSETVAPMSNQKYLASYMFYSLPPLTSKNSENDYFNSLFKVIKYSEQNQKQYILVVDSSIYSDLLRMENGELLKDEEIYECSASDLTSFEQLELRKEFPSIISGNTPLTEEYLCAQIYYFYTVLNKAEQFDTAKEYTELDKMEAIKDILGYRYHYLNRYKKAHLTFIQEVDVKTISNTTKAKMVSSTIPLSNAGYMSNSIIMKLSKYREPIVIKSVGDSDLNALFNGDFQLKNKLVFIDNLKYHGYTYSEGIYNFYIGGSEAFYEYVNRPIDVTIVPVNLETLIQKPNSGEFFSDLKFESPII
ncbi:MAG: hypothetical protein NTX05_05555 [Fusobacteria bacterium]|nr:hypothetical protein [Fusobacteriota bacterium]